MANKTTDNSDVQSNESVIDYAGRITPGPNDFMDAIERFFQPSSDEPASEDEG